MIDAELQARDIERLNDTFARYAEVNKRDLDVLLGRKGADLGIKLFQGYRQQRPRSKFFARTELRARTRAGRGTKVRTDELDPKWLNKIPRMFPMRKRRRYSLASAALNRWQLLVGQEVLRRQAGRGFLAASFLWFRRRSSQAKGTYYVKNRTKATLGQVDATGDSFRIRAFPAGLAVIDARYSIVRRAIQASDRDMQAYIEKKQREAVAKAFPRDMIR